MQFYISATSSLASLSQTLQNEYPNLKLMFFTKKHEAQEGSEMKYAIHDTGNKIGDYKNTPFPRELEVNDITVSELEALLYEHTAVAVQVMYRSNGVWLESIKTDYKKLSELNAINDKYANLDRSE
ncbi:MAG: hypothetical protein WAS72_04455 [Saprospiraceae bacterium]